jgi:hypothetical protein
MQAITHNLASLCYTFFTLKGGQKYSRQTFFGQKTAAEGPD